ncbi:hypothetical protein EYF80_008725 [Liparis tanakae]|uniref:Uncharacterized protein n=1 Tax=Liparis tanakae TaxID=230148 RepID=A0A4Z2IST1_9TELE|nr:hypothetical protein EYF80_008725 [Liparis tanakae]
MHNTGLGVFMEQQHSCSRKAKTASPRSPSYSHYGQSCLRRDKLQHWGQWTPGRARGPLLFINQTLQGPRRQQLTQLGQHRLRTAVIHLGDDGSHEDREEQGQRGGAVHPAEAGVEHPSPGPRRRCLGLHRGTGVDHGDVEVHHGACITFPRTGPEQEVGGTVHQTGPLCQDQ